MKKIIFLLASCLLFLSIPITSFGAEEYDQVLLIYMNGSDLESDNHAASKDILEMIEGVMSERVAVIIETGGTKEWHTGKYGLPSISHENNQRWLITDDTIELIEEVESRNMGEEATLKDFLLFGINTYKAKKYSLIMWNHGSGPINGFGVDELYDYDSLTLSEMDRAFNEVRNETGEIFEWIGFDACLMASIEVAALLKDNAKYMIASEEIEPGHGWDYTPIIDALFKESTIDGKALGKIIIDSFQQEAMLRGTDYQITLSLIDLSKIDQILITLDQFVNKVSNGLTREDYKNKLIKNRLLAESYGESGSGETKVDMVDMIHYAKIMMPIYQNQSLALINAVREAVVYKISSSMKPYASGISMYIPTSDENDLYYATNQYKEMDFSVEYTRFIERYHKVLSDGKEIAIDYSNDIEEITEENIDDVSSELSIAHIDANENNYFIKIDPKQLEDIYEVYAVFGIVKDKEEIHYLGKELIDEDAVLEDGTVIGNTVERWVKIGGHFTTMYYDEGTNESRYYYIPIALNDHTYDLIIEFSDTETNGKILGARALYNSENHYYNRKLVDIKPGDSITFLSEYDKYKDNAYYYDGWMSTYTYTVTENFELEWVDLPEGLYGYKFEIHDIYGNEYHTEWMNYEYVEENEEEHIQNNSEEETEVSQQEWYKQYPWITDEKDLPSQWAVNYIAMAYDHGLTTEQSLIGFKNNITRDEFCELVVKLYEIVEDTTIIVNEDAYFSDTDKLYIRKAASLGIVNGYPDGTFKPNNEINREQLMAMFYRMLKALGTVDNNREYPGLAFEDYGSISLWAVESASCLVYHGLIEGIGDNRLDPKGTATTEQAIKLVTGVYAFHQGQQE